MTTYRLSPGVRWAVERFAVKVIDGKGTVRTIPYPEAAVWDLVSRGYSFPRVVSMTRYIAALDAAAAESLVRASLHDWAENGVIERT